MRQRQVEHTHLTSPAENPQKRTSLFRNGLANIIGRVWTALIAFAFVPLYIRLLGIEAYGLIGFFATLQSIFALFDLGLSTTLNRELALRSSHPEQAQEMRDLVRTLEVVYWLSAILIALIVLVGAPIIASSWINAQSLAPATVQQALALMGLSIALEFPFGFYSGGLLGLQRQVLFNGINVVVATLRAVGALAVLWFITPTVTTFFSWQVGMSALQTALCAWGLWTALPKGSRPSFQRSMLAKIWRFAAGMTGISVVSLLLMELDKIILSATIPLKSFGYYALAAVIASGISVLVAPLFTAVFPRFTQLVARADTHSLTDLYHTSCQVMAVLVLPVGLTIALFAPEVLLLWTGDPTIAAQTWPLVSLLVVGTTLNGLMNIPYALQLAYGWTQLALYQNIIAVLLLVPLLFWSANHYGAVGAACIWPLLNSAYVLLGIQVMHARLLPLEKMRWYTRDVGLPLLGTLLVAVSARFLLPEGLSRPLLAVCIGVIALLTIAAAALLTPFTAWWLRQRTKAMIKGTRAYGS